MIKKSITTKLPLNAVVERLNQKCHLRDKLLTQIPFLREDPLKMQPFVGGLWQTKNIIV